MRPDPQLNRCLETAEDLTGCHEFIVPRVRGQIGVWPIWNGRKNQASLVFPVKFSLNQWNLKIGALQNVSAKHSALLIVC